MKKKYALCKSPEIMMIERGLPGKKAYMLSPRQKNPSPILNVYMNLSPYSTRLIKVFC